MSERRLMRYSTGCMETEGDGSGVRPSQPRESTDRSGEVCRVAESVALSTILPVPPAGPTVSDRLLTSDTLVSSAALSSVRSAVTSNGSMDQDADS